MRKRTIHKAAAALTALALCAGVLTGCGGAASSTTASSTAGSAASSEVSGEEADELAAKNVADLIDAIYAIRTTAYPDWSVRRAFTAQIIINHVQARDGEKIDNMQQALDRAVANGVKNLVVQPTHLMHSCRVRRDDGDDATSTRTSWSPLLSPCWSVPICCRHVEAVAGALPLPL